MRRRDGLSLLVVALACLCSVALRKPDGDADIWSRMAVGKLVIETGKVTTDDPFSYTEKLPQWIDHEWGSGVVFYLFATLGGQTALLLLKASLMFGTIACLFLRVRLRTSESPSLLFHLFLIDAIHLGFLATIRAQAFTYFFFSLWMYLLDRAWRGDWRGLWVIPATAVFWANVHGGFLAGIGLIVLYAAAALLAKREWPRFTALASVSGALSLVNPYGLSYWTYLLSATTMSRESITEWRPLDLWATDQVFWGFKLLLAATLVLAGRRLWQREAVSAADALCLAVTAFLGFRAIRHTTFFVIAAAPVVWEWLLNEWSRIRLEREGGITAAQTDFLLTVWRRYVAGSRIALVGIALVVLATTPLRVVLVSKVPVRAIDFIDANDLRGNLLVSFNFGSYATWRLYPRMRVAIDGRFETVYTDRTYRETAGFFRGDPGWDRFLGEYRHDVILMSPRNARAEANLATRPEWHLAFEDEKSRVYVRGEVSNLSAPAAREGDPFSTAGMPSYVVRPKAD